MEHLDDYAASAYARQPELSATSSFSFFVGAQVESKLTDALTGEVMAAAVDRRLGSGSVAAGFQWKWGDVKNAMDTWGDNPADDLHAWTPGAKLPYVDN